MAGQEKTPVLQTQEEIAAAFGNSVLFVTMGFTSGYVIDPDNTPGEESFKIEDPGLQKYAYQLTSGFNMTLGEAKETESAFLQLENGERFLRAILGPNQDTVTELRRTRLPSSGRRKTNPPLPHAS